VRSVVGPARQFGVVVAGGDADLVREVIPAWVTANGFFVVVVAGVAGRGDEQDVVGAQDFDLLLERRGGEGAKEGRRVVDDADVHARPLGRHDPFQRFDQLAGFVAAAGRFEPLDGQDRGLPVDAGHADAVVAHRAHDARHVRAMTAVGRDFLVHRIAACGHSGTQHVIAMGARRTAADAAGVRPDVGRQVGVFVVDAGVGLGDHDRAAASAHLPGLRCAIVVAGSARRRRSEHLCGFLGGDALSGVAVGPLQRERWVVGHRAQRDRRAHAQRGQRQPK
jgi:hypothetical protein